MTRSRVALSKSRPRFSRRKTPQFAFAIEEIIRRHVTLIVFEKRLQSVFIVYSAGLSNCISRNRLAHGLRYLCLLRNAACGRRPHAGPRSRNPSRHSAMRGILSLQIHNSSTKNGISVGCPFNLGFGVGLRATKPFRRAIEPWHLRSNSSFP